MPRTEFAGAQISSAPCAQKCPNCLRNKSGSLGRSAVVHRYLDTCFCGPVYQALGMKG